MLVDSDISKTSKETAVEAHREFQKVYGGAALSETMCRDWFRRFKDGDFDVDDRPREGRQKPSKTSNWRHCSIGDDSKTRNLGSLWFEVKGRWASSFLLWTTASAAIKEGFSSSYRDGWWRMDSLQQPKENKVMGTAQSCFYVIGSAEYSRCEGYAVYLGRPGPRYLLWAVETERNHHWGMVSTIINAFEPRTVRKTATIRAEARKSDSTAWQRSNSRCQTCSKLPGNAQMASLIPPAVFPRYCAVRILLVPIDGTSSGWSAVPLIWRHWKMAWFVDSLKRWTLLP